MIELFICQTRPLFWSLDNWPTWLTAHGAIRAGASWLFSAAAGRPCERANCTGMCVPTGLISSSFAVVFGKSCVRRTNATNLPSSWRPSWFHIYSRVVIGCVTPVFVALSQLRGTAHMDIGDVTNPNLDGDFQTLLEARAVCILLYLPFRVYNFPYSRWKEI